MMYVMTEIKMRSESEVEFKEKMASITGPQILLHSGSPWLKQTMKPSSSPFLLFPKHTPRRTFCSINSNSKGSSSIVPDLLHYLNHSWTQFHATAEAKRQLLAAGFHMLDENHDWHLKPGGRYFFTRNMSCLIAFAIGDKSAHFTSSPSLFYFSLSPNVIVSLLVFC